MLILPIINGSCAATRAQAWRCRAPAARHAVGQNISRSNLNWKRNVAPNPDKGRLYAGQASRRRVRSSGRRARGALFTNTDRGHADCTIAACLRSPAWRTDLTMSTSVRFGCSPRPRLTRRLSPTSCAARASIASTSSQFLLRARHMTTRAGRFSEKTAMANLDAPTAYTSVGCRVAYPGPTGRLNAISSSAFVHSHDGLLVKGRENRRLQHPSALVRSSVSAPPPPPLDPPPLPRVPSPRSPVSAVRSIARSVPGTAPTGG